MWVTDVPHIRIIGFRFRAFGERSEPRFFIPRRGREILPKPAAKAQNAPEALVSRSKRKWIEN
jgi:hypothetical protein